MHIDHVHGVHFQRDSITRFFASGFFHIFSQAPENNIRVISNFSQNSRRYSQIKVRHQYHRCKFANGVNDTSRKICHRCHLHWWQMLLMLTLLPKGVQTKYLKLFICRWHIGAPWAANFSAYSIYKKNLKWPFWNTQGLRGNLKSKTSWHCPFKPRYLSAYIFNKIYIDYSKLLHAAEKGTKAKGKLQRTNDETVSLVSNVSYVKVVI